MKNKVIGIQNSNSKRFYTKKMNSKGCIQDDEINKAHYYLYSMCDS